MAGGGVYNIRFRAGTTYDQLAQAKDAAGNGIDFTGYDTLRSELRDKPIRDGGVLQATITATWDDQTTGIVRLYMSPATTAAISAVRGVWSVEAEDSGGDVVPILNGTYEVLPEITD